MLRALPFSLLLAGACASGSRLEAMEVADVTLTDVKLFRIGAVAGVEAGGGTFEVVTAEGEDASVPVTLSGPRLGAMLDVAYGWSFIDLPLSWEGDGVRPGTDVLGTYQGAEYSTVAGVGVHVAILTNEHGVTLALNSFDIGVAGSANYVWLTMEEAQEGGE